jgi:hypothetical protein
MGEVIDLERERRARERVRQRRDKALRDAAGKPAPAGKIPGGGPEEPSTPGQDGGAGSR